MFFKKTIVSCLVVCAVSIPCIPVYAHNRDSCIQVVDKHNCKEKHKSKSLDNMSSEELKKIADKLKIDITGLTDSQIKEKIKESRPKHKRFDKMTSEELKSLAEKLKIDTTDLSDEQLKEKIIQAIKEKKANRK